MSGGEGEQPASFQHLVDTMPGAVFLRDQAAVAERRMSYVSPQTERVTGVSAWRWLAPDALDLLGEFLDEPTLAEHRARADVAAERGEQYDAVFRIRGDDGRIRWVRHHSVVLPDAPRTRIGFWLDVTENRYHDMVEGLPAIVAVLDMNADEALFVNPQVERITGMPPAHWTRPGGLDEFRSRVHPDDYPEQGGLPRFGRTRSAEFRWIRPDGRTRWLRSVSARLPGTDGLVQALAFDVTAEMRAAEGLAQQRHRYQTLVEQLPVATFVTDAEGVLTYISPQIEPILGVTPEQLVGMSAEARQHLVVEDDRPLMERAGGRLYRGETDRYDIQLRMRNAGDGKVRHVHMIARDLRDGEGTRLALQGVIVDVTDQRMAEQRRHEALEALVTAAEAEQTRISAELHDDTVQVMTAMLMQIRRLGGDDPRVAELETMLAGALDRTRRLMFELRPQVLQRAGLAAAIEELAAEGPWSSHVVEIDVPRQSDTTEALVYRTIRELIINARKHSQASELRVSGAVREGELVFDVRDDGVGFDLERALDRDLMRMHVGLDTSAERVRVAGGELRMESRPGQGARFQLRLPVAPAVTG
jgi:PAS domain S-box-containing protein